MKKEAGYIDWPLIFIVTFMGMVLIGLLVVIGTKKKHEAEVKEGYIYFCVKDQVALGMERAEAEQRCEISWDMQMIAEEKGAKTTIIPIIMQH